MADEFVFIPQGLLLTDDGVKTEYIKVETPETIAKYIKANEWLLEFFGSPGDIKEDAIGPIPVPISDEPLIIAEAEVWAAGFEMLGFDDVAYKPHPDDPDPWPFPFHDPYNPFDPDGPGGWGPCFIEVDTLAELGYF